MTRAWFKQPVSEPLLPYSCWANLQQQPYSFSLPEIQFCDRQEDEIRSRLLREVCRLRTEPSGVGEPSAVPRFPLFADEPGMAVPSEARAISVCRQAASTRRQRENRENPRGGGV